MKPFLVINPHSAGGQTGKRWAELRARISSQLGDFGHAFTERVFDGARLTQKALRDGYDCIVAVGGDGTLNEVVNGFFDGDTTINPSASVALIARGTGGDFGRTFGWSMDLDAALARIRSGSIQPLDIGLVKYVGHDGRAQQRYFANICSFGASGVVDQEVGKAGKYLGGKLSFMIGSTKALLRYQDQNVRVRLDEGPPEDLRVTTLAVANGKYFGGGMRVAPDAVTSDGIFDVTLWSGFGLTDFALKAGSLYDGSHVKLSGTRQMRCKSLTAESDAEVLLDIDGEQPGKLPCRITLVPSALRLRA